MNAIGGWIAQWCLWLGVTDPTAVAVAQGIVAGGIFVALFWTVIGIIWGLFVGLLQLLYDGLMALYGGET